MPQNHIYQVVYDLAILQNPKRINPQNHNIK